jgi:hypothetical protein
MASTSGSTVVEIIYCANKATPTGKEPRDAPSACEQALANRIEAFRSGSGAPTAYLGGVTKTPQGEDVYVVMLVI